MNKNLLEDVAMQLENCNYISDLHTYLRKRKTDELIRVIQKIDEKTYSPMQWADMYHYFFNDKINASEAYQSILKKLMR